MRLDRKVRVNDFFDQWDPSTVTLIEDVCGP